MNMKLVGAAFAGALSGCAFFSSVGPSSAATVGFGVSDFPSQYRADPTSDPVQEEVNFGATFTFTKPNIADIVSAYFSDQYLGSAVFRFADANLLAPLIMTDADGLTLDLDLDFAGTMDLRTPVTFTVSDASGASVTGAFRVYGLGGILGGAGPSPVPLPGTGLLLGGAILLLGLLPNARRRSGRQGSEKRAA